MTIRSPFSLLFALACAGLGTLGNAQNVVHVPSDADGRVGSQWESRLPLSNGANRTLMLFENHDTLIPNGRMIQRIGFRMDDLRTGAGAQVLMEIYMGYSQKTAANLEGTFANNFNSPRTLVKAMGTVTLAPITSANQGSLFFIDLDTPFAFDANQSLLVDFVVTANSQGSVSFSYPLDRSLYYSPTRDSGGACPTSAGNLPALSSVPVALGDTWGLRGTNMPGNAITALLFGFDGIQAVGVPLQTFRPAANPQCQIFINPATVASITTTTTTGGGISFGMTIPNDQALLRTPITVQALHLDFFAPGRMVTSNAHEMRIGQDPAVSLVSGNTGPSATIGSLRRNYGIVTVFDHN